MIYNNSNNIITINENENLYSVIMNVSRTVFRFIKLSAYLNKFKFPRCNF